jgi:hypothetical protein
MRRNSSRPSGPRRGSPARRRRRRSSSNSSPTLIDEHAAARLGSSARCQTVRAQGDDRVRVQAAARPREVRKRPVLTGTTRKCFRRSARKRAGSARAPNPFLNRASQVRIPAGGATRWGSESHSNRRHAESDVPFGRECVPPFSVVMGARSVRIAVAPIEASLCQWALRLDVGARAVGPL